MELQQLATEVAHQHQGTPEMVANILREAILRGIFQGGQQLRQEEIAAQLGVSRIPVREALRQLEQEGLVVYRLNRGAIVSELSAAEVQEIYEMRSALESTALRIALPHLTTSDFQRAATILDITDRETDVSRWGELNREFHTILYTPAQRPRLLSVISALHRNVDRYLRMEMVVLHYKERSQQEHRRILEACQQRDAAAAITLLTQHIEAAGELLVAYLKQQQGHAQDNVPEERADREV
ncbi:MAG: GntR family transcriptional regulator [Chloroflexi bacterium]|nr:GntR family transcriptional regulator [Chloroflexota bacterium]